MHEPPLALRRARAPMLHHSLPVLTLLLLSTTLTSASDDALALLAFKRALSDPSGALSTWTLPSSPCLWRGVLCSPSNLTVVELHLPNLHLSGPLPASLSSLTHLRALSLRDNLLSGPLPSAFPPNLRSLFLQRNNLSGGVPLSLPAALRSLDLSFNSLSGPIPATLGSLASLQYLSLAHNLLQGPVPAALANSTTLVNLSLQANRLTGIVPVAVAAIPTLKVLELDHNALSGSVPSAALVNGSLRVARFGFNRFDDLPSPGSGASVLEVLEVQGNAVRGGFPEWVTAVASLVVLDLSSNAFDGPVPKAVGRLLALKELRLGGNLFDGVIPEEIGECQLLQVIRLDGNRFSGEVPASFAMIAGLRELWLGGNEFTGTVPASIGELVGLVTLSLAGNRLVGVLPEEVMRMSNLTYLDLSGNGFTGAIPESVVRLVNVRSLNLSNNGLMGSVPSAVGSLRELRTLDLSGNRNLTGELPNELFGLPNLVEVSLAGNRFSGEVPEGFASLTGLERLNLSANLFSGRIPETYGYLQSLTAFSFSSNNVSGDIPLEIMNCSSLIVLELRSNHLSGHIPVEISQLSNLTTLDLSNNSLSGDIPTTIAALSKLQVLDLSENNLTGTIPSDITRIPGLNYLNVSSNNLSGTIPPALGSRLASDPSFFLGNPALCGPPLDVRCEDVDKRRKRKERERLALLISIIAGTTIVLSLLCCSCVFSLIRWRRRLSASAKKRTSPSRRSGSTATGSSEASADARPKLVMFSSRTTYADTLEATRQFDEENVLCRGRHGLVFKACYADGTVLSILRLPSADNEATFRKEAESLGKLKHRNLTVLRGYYAGPPPDVRLLIYDYMPNGNLATLLQEAAHQEGHVLNWPMRHLIALGVARGLAFLHASDVVHGDIKPQSILFDADFEPHLSDFGLDGLVVYETGASTSGTTIGTVGYVAPETALSGQSSKQGDVYSFGIVLLELLTGKRAAVFAGEDEDIVKWVKRQLQKGQMSELLEPGMLQLDPESSEWEEFLLGVKVGLLCTAPDPADRPALADVVFMLEGCRVGPEDGSPPAA